MKFRSLFVLIVLMLASHLALAISIPSNITPNEGICEDLRAEGVPKALYGLCVAYCEAQDWSLCTDPAKAEECKASQTAGEKILEKFNIKAGDSGIKMPCHGSAFPQNVCPCWPVPGAGTDRFTTFLEHWPIYMSIYNNPPPPPIGNESWDKFCVAGVLTEEGVTLTGGVITLATQGTAYMVELAGILLVNENPFTTTKECVWWDTSVGEHTPYTFPEQHVSVYLEDSLQVEACRNSIEAFIQEHNITCPEAN